MFFTEIKSDFTFYMLIVWMCLTSLFLMDVEAQDTTAPGNVNYTFETIEVPDVDFLAITASSDFEDYAGYTKSADGEKFVAFTLIDGVFMTYDFPGSQNTYFYALANNGRAAGHYEDSEGLHHGIVLDENGELRQYDFPDAVETEIYSISDATGGLAGNWIDAAGVQRGFSGDIIVEYPGASEIFVNFVSAGVLTGGSYIDAEGLYHAYVRTPVGEFLSVDYLEPSNLEYFFFTVSIMRELPLSVRRRWKMSRAPMSVPSRVPYKTVSFSFRAV